MSLDVYLFDADGSLLFSANVTHNLNRMADAAGIYKPLWRPESVGITTARQVAEAVQPGFDLMAREPSRFDQFNAANGWGLYRNFLPWVAYYLEACRRWPDARVEVSR